MLELWNMNEIIISWEGPYSHTEVIDHRCRDDAERQDYGLYQIYGPHLIYTNKVGRADESVLLYIGLAIQCTFSGRISSHGFCHNKNHRIYLGYFESTSYKHDIAKWKSDVSDAERLLINMYAPSYNSQWCGDLRKNQLNNPDTFILNQGTREDLAEKIRADEVYISEARLTRRCS